MSFDATLTIEGTLGRDPELKFTNAGKAVASFPVAVSERRRQGNEWVDGESSWFECSAWDQLAENICESLSKGDRVIVVGNISTDSWADKQTGEKRTKQKITVRSIGPSLKWAAATVTRNERKGGSSRSTQTSQTSSFADESPF